MRTIFFGTDLFAFKILEHILENEKNIVGIVTKEDKKDFCSVKRLYQEKNLKIPIFQPVNISDKNFLKEIKDLKPDLFIVVAYGKILKEELLSIPKLSINIHASLLPRYRGAAPIRRVLMDGEKKTGITIMKMNKKLDCGEIIFQEEVDILDHMDFGDLKKELLKVSKKMIIEVIKLIENNKKLDFIPQKDEFSNYAHKIQKKELFIDWNSDANKIFNLIRAFSPKPGARCFINFNNQKKLLKILKAEIVDIKGAVGQVLNKEGLVVSCKDMAIKILKLQLEGKQVMDIKDFIRGIKSDIKFIV